MNKEKLIKESAIAYDGTRESIEKILILFKQARFTQMESVNFLVFSLHLPLKEADDIVLQSKAWKPELPTNIQLRNSFGDIIEDK